MENRGYVGERHFLGYNFKYQQKRSRRDELLPINTLDPSDKEESARGIRMPFINPTCWHNLLWAADVLFGVKYKATDRQINLELWS